MPKTLLSSISTAVELLRYFARWAGISLLVGGLAGSASAGLLIALDWATVTREANPWLIGLLPVAGLAVGTLYTYIGHVVIGGNNLVLERIHTPGETIPFRMTPLILIGTFMTHLFGGSAGREGTAVQTGASLAAQLARPLRMPVHERRILLMAGVSAGFASVFGTPLAGAVFGLEVLWIGSVTYEAILPCFLSAFLGDFVCRAWHVHHTAYSVGHVPMIGVCGLLWSCLAGAIFGVVALAFARVVHGIGDVFRSLLGWPPLRPFVGGTLVALGVLATGTRRYIGLGIPVIVSAFQPGGCLRWDWLGKFAVTVMTLGSGFKGGEVTPLFFIGATLGNALSQLLPLPTPLLAAMGFVAVFSGAANTPIASTLMAVELFGSEAAAYAGIACVLSYLCSGHAGIYGAQRIGHAKGHYKDLEVLTTGQVHMRGEPEL